MAQSVFQRIEKKYVLSRAQKQHLLSAFVGTMKPDVYGKYTISSLYYDTDHYDLIRKSIDKPVYKEKLRLRSYGLVGDSDDVFVELKKKFKRVVYKRRTVLPYGEAKTLLQGTLPENPTQIQKEILYFLQNNPVSEKICICYDRTAFAGIENPELRITFDANIRFRQTELRLDSGSWGTPLIDSDLRLMEIKVPGAFPLWLSHALSDLQIYPTSFSKYGSCYRQYIAPAVFSTSDFLPAQHNESMEVSASA